jgi:hypothetical protein
LLIKYLSSHLRFPHKDYWMDNTLRLLLLALFILPLIGCRQTAPGEFSRTYAGLTADLTIDPNPPIAMEPALFLLVLSDKEGDPVEGVQISYDLTMPAMTMPPNQPQASDDGDGVYRTEAIFTMSGSWEVRAIVIYNSEEITFTYNILVK